MASGKPDYRDISKILQKFREFLLGRSPHNLHARFPLNIAARSQPPPDIPRSPAIKLASNYYCDRSPFAAVARPVEAPLGRMPQLAACSTDPCGKTKPRLGGPRPGDQWGWDDHCNWECQ